MSYTDSIFSEVSNAQGWSEATQIDVLLRYIANQQSDESFADFLGELAETEAKLCLDEEFDDDEAGS